MYLCVGFFVDEVLDGAMGHVNPLISGTFNTRARSRSRKEPLLSLLIFIVVFYYNVSCTCL